MKETAWTIDAIWFTLYYRQLTDLSLKCWYINTPKSPDSNLSLSTMYVFHHPPTVFYLCVIKRNKSYSQDMSLRRAEDILMWLWSWDLITQAGKKNPMPIPNPTTRCKYNFSFLPIFRRVSCVSFRDGKISCTFHLGSMYLHFKTLRSLHEILETSGTSVP